MLLKYFMSNIQIEFLFAESNKNVGSPVKLLIGWVLIKSWWHEHGFLGYILQVLLAEMLPEVKYLGI